jgi:hypothetical protein
LAKPAGIRRFGLSMQKFLSHGYEPPAASEQILVSFFNHGMNLSLSDKNCVIVKSVLFDEAMI